MAKRSVLLLVTSVLASIQSVIWIAACIAAILVYLCVLEVSPYKDESDFFRVTLVKLYFEGRQCILDGSYLGQFELEYTDSSKISLLTPDIVFAIMGAYVILHLFQFFLSISLYRANNKGKGKDLCNKVINWSLLTLVISALDAFLSAELFWDMYKLIEYSKEDYAVFTKENDIKGIEYIPLIVGLASSRLVVLWLYNLCVALSNLLCAMCCDTVFTKEKEKKLKPKPPRPPTPPPLRPVEPDIYTILPSPEDVNKVVGRITTFDTHYGVTRRKDWDIYSKKTVTHYKNYSGRVPQVKASSSRSPNDNQELAWDPSKRLYQNKDTANEESREIQVEMVNDGFVDDERKHLEEERDTDSIRHAKNHYQGRGEVRIQKSPVGKYVPPPVCPTEKENDSFNC